MIYQYIKTFCWLVKNADIERMDYDTALNIINSIPGQNLPKLINPTEKQIRQRITELQTLFLIDWKNENSINNIDLKFKIVGIAGKTLLGEKELYDTKDILNVMTPDQPEDIDEYKEELNPIDFLNLGEIVILDDDYNPVDPIDYLVRIFENNKQSNTLYIHTPPPSNLYLGGVDIEKIGDVIPINQWYWPTGEHSRYWEYYKGPRYTELRDAIIVSLKDNISAAYITSGGRDRIMRKGYIKMFGWFDNNYLPKDTIEKWWSNMIRKVKPSTAPALWKGDDDPMQI